MERMTVQNAAATVGRPSIRNARVSSRFRGVVRDDGTGKWLARKGISKDYFLGSYETEEEAAVAFDIRCIKQEGYQAITNYDIRCYDVGSILKAQKLLQQQQQAMLEWQTARNFTMQQPQQPLKRPSACRLNILSKNLATEEQKSQFQVWALETARKELASATNSSFQHGAFSPFCSYQEMTRLEEEQENSDSALGHGTSSAFESFSGTAQCSYGTERTDPHSSLGPYQINFETEKMLRAQGLGFEHASSSGFKPYNDPGNKGKGKVNF